MFHNENSQLISNAIQYAKTHLKNADISVETIAEKAGFSTNYFNRIFTAHTGFSVMEYVRFERLRKAAYLLRNTKKDIFDIALEVGYESHEGFIRAFKTQYELTPTEYRESKKHLAMTWGEMIDYTLVQRFLFEHKSFRLVDEDELIDSLLMINAKRFGYLCTSIKAMGLKAVTEFESIEEGFVLIGDTRNSKNEYYLILVSDNGTTISRWMDELNFIQDIHTSAMDILPKDWKARKEYMYFGEKMSVELTNDIQIHQLSSKDNKQIQEYVGNRKDGYAQHLLHLEQCQSDPSVLEYGVFKNDIMIAAVGCGIDTVHGFSINDSIHMMFKPEYENDALYKETFMYITNDILKRNIIPFDNIQYGDYAASHGNFSSEGIGYELVNCVYYK